MCQNKTTILTILLFSFFILIESVTVQPVWNVYPHNIMYSGQYVAINSTKGTGYFLSPFNQQIYRSSPVPNSYFATSPKVILSLLGFKQLAPSLSSIFVGFDARITTITTRTFQIEHNIYGANMFYLNYMYLAVLSPDYNVGQYLQTFDIGSTNKTYSIDIAFNAGQNYPNYSANKIEMKGFLTGYKMQQGTANGMYLNFTLKLKNSSFFRIQVSCHQNSILQRITFSRIGYDRTDIQRRTYNDIFRDFYFQLTNNINTANISQFGWASATEFQYRNYLMGTNKINIQGNGINTTSVQFILYYYFAQSIFLIDRVYPPYQSNPAKAQYLYGETFYHVTKSCTNGSFPFYLQLDRKCYSACPVTGFYTDNSSKTCIACHFSCRTCSQPYLNNTCLTCDINLRTLDNSTFKCLCPIKKYDDGINMACVSCHNTCLTCSNSSAIACKSCNSTDFRQLEDPDNDNLGQCSCLASYFQNTTTLICQKCSLGCIACILNSSTNTAQCSACNTTKNFKLNGTAKSCQCSPTYVLVGSNCMNQVCGDGIKTVSEQCDDNNTKNADGCSLQCKIQPNHVCLDNLTNVTYSVCYYNGSIGMDITQVTKDPYDNKVNLIIRVMAPNINSDFLKGYLKSMTTSSILLQDKARRLLENKIRLLQTNSANLKITNIDYVPQTGILKLSFSYDQTFDITTKQIRIVPSVSTSSSSQTYFYNSPTAVISLQKTHNKIDTIFYDKSQYTKAINFKYAFQALIISYWIICIIFIAIKKANVAMQMMLVLQITYASLLSQQHIQITFGGLSQFGKFTSGYSVQFLTNYNRCVNFISIKLSCSLIDNLNISFFIMVFLVLVYNLLRLINKFNNYKAEQQFNEQKRKNVYKDNQRTIQNIAIQNQQNMFYLEPAQDRAPDVSSESSHAIEQKYYKQKEFIPKYAYNILLDCIYFLAFVTVMIWVLSFCYIKQQTTPSIVLAAIIAVFYIFMWIYWFVKYFSSDFSFVQAHKKVQSSYPEDDQSNKSQMQNEQQGNSEQQRQRDGAAKQKKNKQNRQIKKRSFTPALFRILFYPLIWASSLGIALVLALTESIGYVAQSLIIGGSFLFAIIIWLTQIYKQKLHIFRAILNCLLLSGIQGVYIVLQKDNLVGTGATISIVVYALLGVGFLTNTTSTIYLYYIQRKLQQKVDKANFVSQLQKKIDQLQQIKRKKQIEDMGIFFKEQSQDANQQPMIRQQVRQQEIHYTIKKNPGNSNYNGNIDQNDKTLHKKYQQHLNDSSTKLNMNPDIILTKNKVGGSQPYFPDLNKKGSSYLQNEQQYMSKLSSRNQLNMNGPDNFLSKYRSQNQLKYRLSQPSQPKVQNLLSKYRSQNQLKYRLSQPSQPKVQRLSDYHSRMSESQMNKNNFGSTGISNINRNNQLGINNSSLTNIMIDSNHITLNIDEDAK